MGIDRHLSPRIARASGIVSFRNTASGLTPAASMIWCEQIRQSGEWQKQVLLPFDAQPT